MIERVFGKEKCPHFGNPNYPPATVDCGKCPDLEECALTAGIWINGLGESENE